jgi:hypothetical protein
MLVALGYVRKNMVEIELLWFIPLDTSNTVEKLH